MRTPAFDTQEFFRTHADLDLGNLGLIGFEGAKTKFAASAIRIGTLRIAESPNLHLLAEIEAISQPTRSAQALKIMVNFLHRFAHHFKSML